MTSIKEKNGYLPLGSVVSLTGGQKRLSIIGRTQVSAETKEQFDYAGVLFPEGYQQADQLYLFNNSDIEHISQMGLIDDEELAFQHFLSEK